MENNNQTRISLFDVIDNNAYKNEKAYNLSKALLEVATLARSIKFSIGHDIRGNGMTSIENVNDWMEEMVTIANKAVREEMLTEKL